MPTGERRADSVCGNGAELQADLFAEGPVCSYGRAGIVPLGPAAAGSKPGECIVCFPFFTLVIVVLVVFQQALVQSIYCHGLLFSDPLVT